MKKKARTRIDQGEIEKFEQFLFEMSDALELFVAEAREAGFNLDSSMNSLDTLEQYLLQKSASSNDGQLRNRAARYLGEVFRKNVGGKWELFIEDPRNLFFGLPVISGYSVRSIEFCPIEMISNCLARRRPGLLKEIVKSHFDHKR
jgi:hypothetical protein